MSPVPALRKSQTLRATKKIRVKRQHPAEADRIAKAFETGPVMSRILAARGFKADDELKLFLTPSLREGLPEPAKLKNLETACALTQQMITDGNSIAIACDFDVDGLSGGSVVAHFLKAAGAACEVYVPDRFTDGYGLNEKIIRRAATSGHKLLITVDYGTTNQKELELARELGMKSIVIDHHHVGTIKSGADVLVNPHQSGCGFADGILSAAGLAWYFICGMRRYGKDIDIDPKTYLDLACLGTICDMVPLIGVNRIIAKRGLEALRNSTRPGLIALKEVSGVTRDVTCTHVGFGIGPRINAAGRLVHGEIVVELLTTDDQSRARRIARDLDRLNLERQETELRIKERAIQTVEQLGIVPWGVTVWDEAFHTGVIGIVAQRLVETFHRPAAVIGCDNGLYKGSVRGIRGMNVVETLSSLGNLLVKFGGHEGAGGFSLEKKNLNSFAEAFSDACEKALSDQDIGPYSEADTTVTFDELGLSLIDELKKMAPLGMGNPAPQLLIDKLSVLDVKVLKEQHLKVTLFDGKRKLSGLMWRADSHPALQIGSEVRVVAKPEVNLYSGYRDIQLNIQAAEVCR